MTQKKKRPMNGGGGILSMFSSAAPEPEPHSTVLELEPEPEPEPVDILFITTHGEYAEPKMVEFQSPINKIHKINVAPIGECCKLSETMAETIKSGLEEILTHSTDMDMTYLLKKIEETLKLHESAMNLNPNIDNIPTVKVGDNITDKNYFVRVKEMITTESPYYDTITLLARGQGAVPNLLKDIGGMPTRNTKEISIKLSKILQHIKEKFPEIINLIIVDVTCSEVCSSTHNRKMTRDFKKGYVNFGGNYKNKSIGKVKKLKKTNHKKLRNTKTKRRKTRKMRRRLNK